MPRIKDWFVVTLLAGGYAGTVTFTAFNPGTTSLGAGGAVGLAFSSGAAAPVLYGGNTTGTVSLTGSACRVSAGGTGG